MAWTQWPVRGEAGESKSVELNTEFAFLWLRTRLMWIASGSKKIQQQGEEKTRGWGSSLKTHRLRCAGESNETSGETGQKPEQGF